MKISYRTPAIRDLLKVVFDDQELTIFCFDHFRPVHEKFSSEMSRLWKIQLLLDYCERHEQFDELLALLKKTNPKQYNKFIPSIREPNLTSVEVTFRGDISGFTPELQQAAVGALSGILNIPREQISILQVQAGSIILQIELPTEAANQLIALYQANDPVIQDAGILQVRKIQEQSPKAVKSLDKMKGDFVTAIAYNLQITLATIKGYVELVRMDGSITARQEEALDGIAHTANSMISLIEDSVKLSRAEQLEEQPREKIHLEDSIETSLNSMKVLAGAKEIKLVLDKPKGDLVVEGNMAFLSQALGNLLDNAIKFTPRGGTVRVKLGQSDDKALVSIIDNGQGIQDKDLSRLIKIFEAGSTKFNLRSTGLGLTFVKSIVEQHGGQVSVESQPNVGTTFTISLPISKDVS